MSKENILYRVTVILNQHGLTNKITEWSCVSKVKTYTISFKGRDKFEDITKHLKKHRIGVVEDNIMLNNLSQISFSVFCFADQLESKTNECKLAVIVELNKYKEQLDELLKHIEL